MNNGHAIALRLIKEASERGANSLILSTVGCEKDFDRLGPAFDSLARLEVLDISVNDISALPEFLGKLKHLRELFASINLLESIEPVLPGLSRLELLEVADNNISHISEAIGSLKHLVSLNVANNRLTSLPNSIGNLLQLNHLDVSGNELTVVPNSFENLSMLEQLNVSKNHLASLPDWIGQLNNLRYLSICDNSLASLPESIGGLKNLSSLYARDNDLLSLPEAVSNLQSLEVLDISNNRLTSLPDGLCELKLLKTFSITSNNLNYFPEFLIELPSLQYLYLGSNPIELLRLFGDGNCLPEARAHFADLRHGAGEDRSLLCIVLGNGGVGKSCIVSRLLEKPFVTKHMSTHAIRREELVLPAQDDGDAIRLRICDFGGQDIYHGTHRLFARAKAIFVIVWDAATENTSESDDGSGKKYANYPIAYWLDYIARQSPDSPVLIVQNKVDMRPTIAFQSADYANFVDKCRSLRTCQVSAKDERGFGSLRAHLFSAAQDALGSLESRRHGNGRLRIMRQLETWKREAAIGRSTERRVLPLDEFYTICRADGGISSPEHFLEFLHHTGAVFYDPRYLPQQIIVDQGWAIDGIYALFDRARTLEPLLKAGGRFTQEQLERLVWMDSRYTAKEQTLFLEFMQACELCFVLDAVGPEYLAPELAPEFKEVDTDLRDLGSDANVIFIYEHEILHLNLARRFFVQVGRRYANRARYFRDAVEFRTSDNRNTARVRAVFESGVRRLQGRIEIVTQGPDRNSLVLAIRRHFEQMHDFGLPLPMRVSVDGGGHFASLDRILLSWKTG